MAEDKPQTVDDLQYQFPPNILTYETRFMAGLTMTDMLAAALPFVGVVMMLQSIVGMVLGVLAGVAGLLAVKKFERLGNRNLPSYLLARLIHHFRHPEVELPLIVPRGSGATVSLQTWDGDELVSLGGDN
jgi:hypothetical protein